MKLDDLLNERRYDADHRHYDYHADAELDVGVEDCYRDFWAELLSEEPSLEIKRELYDFHGLMEDLPLLFDEITGGMISKPNTAISAVLEEYREKRERDIQEAIEEHEAMA
jgi:hypothetical protein